MEPIPASDKCSVAAKCGGRDGDDDGNEAAAATATATVEVI